MLLELIGRDRMHSGQTQKIGFAARCRTLGVGGAETSVCASPSDSIVEDFRDHPAPNGEGQRQTERAGLSGTKIPCLQTPNNTRHFPFWNQLVAAESEDPLRQVNFISVCPEVVGTEMATLSHFCASLLYGIFPESFPTQDAVSMANPEV
jgi:hypothetical protein